MTDLGTTSTPDQPQQDNVVELVAPARVSASTEAPSDPNVRPLQPADIVGIENALRGLGDLEHRLGVLRKDYLSLERQLLTQLEQAQSIRDSVIKSLSDRYIDGAPGNWSYDSSQKALVRR